MDQPCSYPQLQGCLRGIERVNRLTRAYHPTLDWLGSIGAGRSREAVPLHIVDVGCGGGDMLRRIHAWAGVRGVRVRLTGIDLNGDAVRAAREATEPGAVTYVTGLAQEFQPEEGIDVVISSLLTHHMEERAVVEFLDWMESVARVGWFVNDLHRQPIPYYGFKVMCSFTRWHPFVQHDGPVSILRSFRREDWVRMCDTAALPRDAYRIVEYRPARLCVARGKKVVVSEECDLKRMPS